MPISKKVSDIDVLTAAKQRIKNIWSKSPKMYLAFSAGKDSLCCSHLLLSMAQAGEIDISKLTVYFIDEEGLYPSMVKAAETWRKKFMMAGARFDWYCLPFKQVCTLDSLSASESWVTWEPGKEDVWMRTPPPYAIMKSKYLHYAGEVNYQTFCDRMSTDGITIVGLRTAESFTRLQMIAKSDINEYGSKKFYPIYDWADTDVWLYIKENNLEFPEIYMRLYEAGVNRKNLRLSAFFGDKTTQGLRWISQTDPNLWERIEKRMPNAYLVMLYWDSEMFARDTRKRKNDEEAEPDAKDYKALVIDMLFKHTDNYRINHDTKKTLPMWKKLVVGCGSFMTEKDFKKIYEVLLAGDPKMRDYRSIMAKLWKRVTK